MVKLISVYDVYDQIEVLLNPAHIEEVQAVYGKEHRAAIRLAGRNEWIRVRESVERIGKLVAEAEEE